MAETMSREDIEAHIAALAAKRDRMPAHWAERRGEIAEQIDDLVEDWLASA